RPPSSSSFPYTTLFRSVVDTSNGGKVQPETVLTGGNVVDGTGAPARRADLVLGNGRIAHVVPPGKAVSTGTVVDVSGLTVAPGRSEEHTSELQSRFDLV